MCLPFLYITLSSGVFSVLTENEMMQWGFEALIIRCFFSCSHFSCYQPSSPPGGSRLGLSIPPNQEAEWRAAGAA